MAEKINVLTLSVKATAVLPSETFATVGGALPAAGGHALGVTAAAAAIGDMCPVQTDGVAIVVAGAAFAADVQIQSDVNGNAILQTSTNAVLGRSIDAASGAGVRVRVKLIPN